MAVLIPSWEAEAYIQPCSPEVPIFANPELEPYGLKRIKKSMSWGYFPSRTKLKDIPPEPGNTISTGYLGKQSMQEAFWLR